MEPFVISVGDACGDTDLSTLTAPILKDQVYTETDHPLVFQIPEFESKVKWCEVRYSYSVELPDDSKDSVRFNTENRTFTIESTKNLTLSGSTSTEYII